MKKFENLTEVESLFPQKLVKKEILARKNMRILLIKMTKDQEIKPHPEKYAVFFFIIEGSAIFTTGEGETKITKNEALYLDSNEMRGIKPLENLILLGVQIYN